MSDVSANSAPLIQQGVANVPLPGTVVLGSSAVSPPTGTDLSNFDGDVWDLSSESLLVRIARALLGDAGAGRIAKAYFYQRLRNSIPGSHFWDLDSFYGALFSVWRLQVETPTNDPASSDLTPEEWATVAIQDDSYRSRVEQFARALAYGGTGTGVKLIAEALLSIGCDVYESWVQADESLDTYGDLEALGNYSVLEGQTYAALESPVGGAGSFHGKRNNFLVVPHRNISNEENYAVTTVLRKIVPITATFTVSSAGVPNTTAVPIRAATSDSEYWTIQSSDPANGALPATRPAFSAYQGEAWSHLTNLSGISSYALNDDGTVRQDNLFDIIPVPSVSGVNGPMTTVPFPPPLAMTTLRQILAGRSVSDGICVVHPYFFPNPIADSTSPLFNFLSYWFYSLTPDKTIPNITPLRIDAYPLSALTWDNQKADGPLDTVQYGQRYWEFWATPSRLDDQLEVVELRLKSPELTNYVSFLAAKFPQHIEFQAWLDGAWVTLYEKDIYESFPQVIPNFDMVAWQARTHPQHYLDGHWEPCSGRVPHVYTDRYRITMRRFNQMAPMNQDGGKHPYSLAIKSWDVGYRISSEGDIPRPSESPGGVFASMMNVAGDTVTLSAYREPASNILSGSGIWRCDPMPTNAAVVSLYLDMRDANGNTQPIDKLYLEPVRSGPTFNLYYSNDTSTGPFATTLDSIPIEQRGTSVHTPAGIDNTTPGSAVQVDVSSLDWNLADPWWIAGKVRLHYPTTDPTWKTIIQWPTPTSQNNILGCDGEIIYLFIENVYVAGVVISIPAETDFVYEISHDGQGHYALTVATMADGIDGALSSQGTGPVDAENASTLTIGADSTFGSPGPLLLEALVVGTNQDAPSFDTLLGTESDGQFVSIDNYAIPQADGAYTFDYTDNTILRFHPALYDSEIADSTGFEGGPADFFGSLVWTPVNRNYKLTKGWIDFPIINAKWVKLEFSNLIPEPTENLLPITRTVKLFPRWMTGNTQTTDEAPSNWKGQRQNLVESTRQSYNDSPTSYSLAEEFQARQVFIAQDLYGRPVTSMVLSPDLQTAQDWADRSRVWAFQQWQAGTEMPRWKNPQQHIYDEYVSMVTEKIGYFVGLNSIAASRADYSVDDSATIYVETFDDNKHLLPGQTWDAEDGYIVSVSALNSQITSTNYGSYDNVQAIQFATEQTDAVQVLANDNFRYASYSLTHGFEDISDWHSVGDAILSYDIANPSVTIDRDTSSITIPPANQGDLGSGIWGRVQRPIFQFQDNSYTPVTSTYGGLSSGPITPSPKGMIYAVVRLVGLTETTNPIRLQIIGSDGTTVLAETDTTVHKGQTVEVEVAYQMGLFTRTAYQAWTWRPGVFGPPFRPVEPSTPAVPIGTPPAPVLDQFVTVRVIQEGASTDSVKVERLSLFDESITWEFSTDGGSTWVMATGGIRNNINGLVSFPNPSNALCWRVTAYRPNMVVSGVQIRPWYQYRFEKPLGIPYRGANVSAYDQFPPIEADPWYKRWKDPVPSWWWHTRGALQIFPAPGQPGDSPYNQYINVVATDNVSTPTDSVSVYAMMFRTMYESAAEVSSTVTASTTKARTISESIATPTDSATGNRLYGSHPTMMRAPFSRVG